MTYVSEGLRGLMVPRVPHIQTWICFVVAVVYLVVLMVVGHDRLQPPGPGLSPPTRPLRSGHGQSRDVGPAARRRTLDRVVVVSPHFDDAALGAAHLLTSHPGSTVVTVLAGRPPVLPRPSSPSGTPLGGFVAGDDVVAARREEDRAAMASLGADPVWLEFADHQYLSTRAAADAGRRRPGPGARHRPRPARPPSSCPWGWPTPTTS